MTQTLSNQQSPPLRQLRRETFHCCSFLVVLKSLGITTSRVLRRAMYHRIMSLKFFFAATSFRLHLLMISKTCSKQVVENKWSVSILPMHISLMSLDFPIGLTVGFHFRTLAISMSSFVTSYIYETNIHFK